MSAITFDDVLRDLVEPYNLESHVAMWSHKYKDPDFIDFVTGFRHEALLDVEPHHVKDAIRLSSHSLGTLVKQRDTHNFINNTNPPWAFSYLYHRLLERDGHVPTWGDFFTYITGDAAQLWWNPVRIKAAEMGIDPTLSYTACVWRMATSWQGLTRVVYAFSHLRDHGIPVNFHIFAHVNLKLDGWFGDHAYRLVMPSEYDQKRADPRVLFGGRLMIEEIEIERGGFGGVWLPSMGSIGYLADWLIPNVEVAR